MAIIALGHHRRWWLIPAPTYLIHEADAEWLARGQVPPGGRSGFVGTVIDRAPILVGDAVFHRGQLTPGPDALATDPATRDASFNRFPSHITAIGFAHGVPLTGDNVSEFTAWLGARPFVRRR